MKFKILLILNLSVTMLAHAAKHDEAVEKILSQMTLEEKVGQMAQVTVDIMKDRNTWKLSDSLMRKGIVDYKIGSLLNTWNNSAPELIEWYETLKTVQSYTQQTRLKIPLVFGIDAIHGANYINKTTLFPQQIGQAATFNRALVRRAGEITAYETRAASLPWTFSPVLDLGIDVRWPRLWETFGEDPYLASALGVEITKGYQGNDPQNIGKFNVMACAKHFLGYSAPVSGKDRTPAIISDNVLREYHLPSFQAAVEAGIGSVMVNSGLINGIPVHASHYYLTDLLKNELNFKGVIVTDWMDIENLYKRDRFAVSSKDAVRLAINAGIDMAMIPYNYDFCDHLIELVNEGAVPMSRIDDAVRRILKMKFELNLFERPYENPANYPLFGSQEFRKAAYETAVESMTLLKNENNILPLASNKKILVTGPNANSMRSLNGGWSYSWLGDKTEQYAGEYNTILEAVRKNAGEKNVIYSPGVAWIEKGKYWEEKEISIKAAVRAARKADYILLCVGENSYTEKPGDTHDLALSDLQIALAKALQATGKPVILVLNQGRPRIINRIDEKSKAILMSYLPGNFGGDAIADVIFGKQNPSGKLPYTYPKYPHSHVNYWHKYSEEQTRAEGMYNYESDYSPLYEFGHGLSYTTFEYSNLKLSKTKIIENETLEVSVDVRNTGKRDGKEAVLLYLSDLYASLAPDMKRLKGFEKIELKAGETKTVKFKITKTGMSFVNIDSKTIVEPGNFEIKIGNLKAGFELTPNP
ncbi:MAG: glycoside hydrolase family 3 C-terminal domain-containing protein [Paludibacteraceae bacterium]|nr:glycoside hydrolase family 3 C-terminal domain-containing protein [Paludibacteraceae bacterium]